MGGQITGDNVLIARETACALGMGTDIRTPEGLPQMTEDGRMPPYLGRDYAHVILPADGFAQVQRADLRFCCSLGVSGGVTLECAGSYLQPLAGGSCGSNQRACTVWGPRYAMICLTTKVDQALVCSSCWLSLTPYLAIVMRCSPCLCANPSGFAKAFIIVARLSMMLVCCTGVSRAQVPHSGGAAAAGVQCGHDRGWRQ